MKVARHVTMVASVLLAALSTEAASAVRQAAAAVRRNEVAAQAPAAPPAQAGAAPLRLTLDEAVRLALEHNLDIAVDRIEPALGESRVVQAKAAYVPAFTTTFTRNHQLQPPTSLLVGTAGVRQDLFSSSAGVSQRLRWGGGSYVVAWDASRTTTTSLFTSFNPSLAARLQVGFSQPLLRDLAIDSGRQQLILSKRNKEISDTRFRETVVRTLADVKRGYWDLVAARAAMDVAIRSLGAGEGSGAQQRRPRGSGAVAAARPGLRQGRAGAAGRGDAGGRGQRPAG